MVLRQLLATLAVDATHVLVVEAPGGWLTRAAIEREIGRRGWRLALSPADADAIVVAGSLGPQLSERVDSVWEQLPGPRSRAAVNPTDHAGQDDIAAVGAALDAVAAELLDPERQTADVRERTGFTPDDGDMNMDMDMDDGDDSETHAGHDMDMGPKDGDDSETHDDDDDDDMDTDAGDGDMDMGPEDSDDSETHDGDMDMDAGDGEMDMDMDMDMEMSPSGIPLAEGGADRDGLEMDELHVALGPVLPHWPAGVVLRCTLQGDVVVAAEASVLDENAYAPVQLEPNERSARWCDQLAGLLALAGWADGRAAAAGARDALVDEPDAASGTRLIDNLQRRLRRARVLRWSLRGIGDLRADDQPTAPPHLHGGVYERMVNLLDQARAELAGDAEPQAFLPDLLAVAERLVVGLDLAAARLVVASLAIDAASPQAEALPKTEHAHHG